MTRYVLYTKDRKISTMKPEDRYPTNRFPNPRDNQRDAASYMPPQPSNSQGSSTSLPQREAAASIVRDRIENIYNRSAAPADYSTPQAQAELAAQPTQTSSQTQATPLQQELEVESPYQRTHTTAPQPQAEHWKQYHTAWQNYYQKYYEHYYVSKVSEATSRLASQSSQQSSDPQATNQLDDRRQDDALYELREKLRQKVRTSSTKIRKSRHFMPIAAALAVVLIFTFLQYNRVMVSMITAYASPGAINPQNLVVDPTASIEVDAEPKLIIPKINVDVPVVYGVGPDNTSQMAAMEQGVAHFSIPGASSTPGQVGNTVISGHSSNDLFDPGNYKFVFAQLEKLNTGDMIYANYEGTRYSYAITKKEVVMPTDVQALIYPTDKPVLTLITCTPLGTAEKRLLVTAEQVSPDPSAARQADSDDSANGSTTFMPSNSPTFTQRLFGR